MTTGGIIWTNPAFLCKTTKKRVSLDGVFVNFSAKSVLSILSKCDIIMNSVNEEYFITLFDRITDTLE